MNKICIIGCYFGNFRSDFYNWLKSCSYNKKIDFKIFSDCDYKGKMPTNVEIIRISLKELKSLFDKKIGLDVKLDFSYKLCDYKPMYGYVFEQYIENYDFWGYCDFDLIFGRIDHFITDEVLKKYDRFYLLGHLSIYRNNDKMKKLFLENNEYKKVCSDNKIYIYDEKNGIYDLCVKNKIKMYNSVDYADICSNNKRLTIAPSNANVVNHKKNYKYQTFLWDNGILYRVYLDNMKNICYEELCYIHYSGRKFKSISSNKFLITNRGYIDIDELNEKILKKINKINGNIKIFEKIEFYYNFYLKRIKNYNRYYR